MSLRIYDDELRAIARCQEIAHKYGIKTGIIRRTVGDFRYYMLTWDGPQSDPEDHDEA